MKKVLSLLLILSMVFALFTGCGNSGGSSSDSSSTTTGTADAESTGTAAKDVTLKVYALNVTAKTLVDQIVSDYKSEAGVTLEWEIPGEDSYTVLKTRFAAGEGPDIFQIGNGDFPGWGVRCLDLSSESWQSNVEEAAIPPMTVDGKKLGLPIKSEASGIVYNKDLFQKAGITEIPDTLDELEQACKQLKTAGIQAFGEAWKNWGFLMHIFGTAFAYEKDPAQTSQKISDGQIKLKDLTYIDNFFRLYDMTLDYGFGKESIGYDFSNQITDFANGKIAMIKQGTWYTDPLLAANPKLNIGLFAVPLTNNPEDTKLMVSTTTYFCINKDSKYTEECKKFFNWFASPDKLEKYIVKGEGYKSPVPYNNVENTDLGPLNTDMLNYLKDNKAYSLYGNEYWPTGFNTDLATPLQAYAAGAADKEKCIEELQSAYDKRASVAKK